MADQRYSREATARGEQSATGTSKCCAYNRTRERFLCADVETGDFPASTLDARLPALTPGSGAALWVVPFRGISPTSVRVPVDLVYLDRNCVVLDAIESFPISSVSSSSRPAASVLVLPANSIASIGMLAGDQLILCSPEEMKRELQQLHSAKVETSTDAGADSAAEQAGRGNSARVLPWVGRSRQKPASENAPVEVAPVAVPAPVVIPPSPESTPTTTPEIAEPEQKKAPKSWLQRLLSPDPPQPRKAEREAIQGLAAFYFNGGDSVAHGVRDISPTGFYVLTEERWYLGTIIRMTLTDRQQAGSERSVTVNASVVRWGNDGVGLQFVCADGKDQRRNKSLSMDGMLPGASKAELEQFVRRLKSGTN